MKNYGVLFDYNGVIVDDEHIQEKAMANVMAQFGFDLTHDLYAKHCLGRTDMAAFESLLRLLNGQDQGKSAQDLTVAKVGEYEQLIKTKSIIHPALKRVVEILAARYRLGVVTASLRDEVMPVLSDNDLLDFFEIVITANDVNRGKPDPEGYLKGIQGLGLAAEQVAVIEDTPSGVAAGKAAGAKCIALLHTVTQDRLTQADKIIRNLGEVTPDLIQKVIKGTELL